MSQSDDAVVLIVEDDEVLRCVRARSLRARGYNVLEVECAEAAGAALRAGLVMLDGNLPGKSGWEFLDAGDVARAGSPPVVVMSAADVDRGRTQEFGVAALLAKPFPLGAFVDTVQQLFGAAGSRL